MKQFLDLAYRFRSTPVVDDDFPLMRDRFDTALIMLRNTLPKIVCLCGSTRFMETFQWANLSETLAGNIVLSVGCNTKSDSDLIKESQLTEEVKQKLDELHKRKIDLADEILVLNIGGYIGDSTRSEIQYANSKGKVIRWLEDQVTTETDDDTLKDRR